MQLQVGMVTEGKVTGITKFGAFVALPEGKSGLVHISEIANTFVNDVHDYVQDGQTVKVKVIGISPDGKINLSIKRPKSSLGLSAGRRGLSLSSSPGSSTARVSLCRGPTAPPVTRASRTS